MNGNQLQPFKVLSRPSFNANDVSSRLKTEVLCYELDLSVARTFAANTFADLNFAGNSFYVDQNSDVGNAQIIFADQPLPGTIVPVYVQAGFIARVPFTRLMIANSAQAGKKLRFFFGVDIDFVPSINGTLSISGNINVVPALDTQGATTDRGYIAGATFASVTALGASGTENVFLAAANTNGAIIWDIANWANGAAGVIQSSLVAKNGAPASVIDGTVLHMVAGVSGGVTAPIGSQRMPRRIASGLGLYFVNNANAQTNGQRFVAYTLL